MHFINRLRRIFGLLYWLIRCRLFFFVNLRLVTLRDNWVSLISARQEIWVLDHHLLVVILLIDLETQTFHWLSWSNWFILKMKTFFERSINFFNTLILALKIVSFLFQVCNLFLKRCWCFFFRQEFDLIFLFHLEIG